MAREPCIISVAITGSVPRKKDDPALPVTTAERIGSTYAAYQAGAALVHVHVRNPDEAPSSDPDRFAAFQQGVRRHCPDIIVQFSTGGHCRTGLEDNIRLDRHTLAPFNAAVVERVAGMAAEHGRPVAAEQGRETLGPRTPA